MEADTGHDVCQPCPPSPSIEISEEWSKLSAFAKEKLAKEESEGVESSGTEQVDDALPPQTVLGKRDRNGDSEKKSKRGPNVFQCPHCSYVATRSNSIKRHIATQHSDDKP
eukprot:2971225-Prymnesium_polylepis.7